MANPATERAALAALLCFASMACDDGGASEEVDAAAPVVDRGRPSSPWSTGRIAGGGVGLLPSLAAGEDRVGVAYFGARARNDGPCEGLPEPVPDQQRWTIHYAELSAGEWQPETAHEPLLVGVPVGLDLAFGPSGASIATLTGTPTGMTNYCGANDAGLLSRAEGWALETVAADSATAPTGEPASDFGEVVGHWAALAFDAEGAPAVAYKDVHAGAIQGDDLTRADLAFAWRQGGAWSHSVIDGGRGAGDHSVLAFDGEGRPLVLYVNPVDATADSRLGLWLARLEGADWVQTRLHAGPVGERPDLAVDPATGELHVVFYDPAVGRPKYARGAAPDALEFVALGDDRFDEGRTPAVAVIGGHAALAWYRCGRVGEDCDPQVDGVVFAWFVDEAWSLEVVDRGDEGLCGLAPDLIADPDDRPLLVYRCSRARDGSFALELDYAQRKALR